MKKFIMFLTVASMSFSVYAKDLDIIQLTKLAAQGNVKAQYNLAYKYHFGEGVAKDEKSHFIGC